MGSKGDRPECERHHRDLPESGSTRRECSNNHRVDEVASELRDHERRYTDTQRQTDRQTETQRDTQRDTQRQAQRHRNIQRDRDRNRNRDRNTERRRETERQRQRHTDTQTETEKRKLNFGSRHPANPSKQMKTSTLESDLWTTQQTRTHLILPGQRYPERRAAFLALRFEPPFHLEAAGEHALSISFFVGVRCQTFVNIETKPKRLHEKK
jgi:hypothetical protein